MSFAERKGNKQIILIESIFSYRELSTISYKISKVSINSKLQNSTVVQIKNYFWQVSSSLIASELVWHGISIQK